MTSMFTYDQWKDQRIREMECSGSIIEFDCPVCYGEQFFVEDERPDCICHEDTGRVLLHPKEEPSKRFLELFTHKSIYRDYLLADSLALDSAKCLPKGTTISSLGHEIQRNPQGDVTVVKWYDGYQLDQEEDVVFCPVDLFPVEYSVTVSDALKSIINSRSQWVGLSDVPEFFTVSRQTIKPTSHREYINIDFMFDNMRNCYLENSEVIDKKESYLQDLSSEDKIHCEKIIARYLDHNIEQPSGDTVTYLESVRVRTSSYLSSSQILEMVGKN